MAALGWAMGEVTAATDAAPGGVALAAEERLVRAIAAGDRDAFLEVYQRHGRALYRYALRKLGDGARAEDLVQEVFLALLKTAPRYRARSPLAAFLFRVARNRLYSWWRDRRPEQGLDVEMPAESASVHDDVLDVRRALAELPAVFREPIELLVYEQLTYQQIASVLSVPIGTVRSRIARGKRRMAARWTGRRG